MHTSTSVAIQHSSSIFYTFQYTDLDHPLFITGGSVPKTFSACTSHGDAARKSERQWMMQAAKNVELLGSPIDLEILKLRY